MNTLNPYTLFTQGKITQAQYIRMIKRELCIIKLNNEVRIDNEKKPIQTHDQYGLNRRRSLIYEN